MQDMDRRTIRPGIVAAGVTVIIACVATLMLLLRDAGSGDNVELGPEETVEAFCRAVTAGDFDCACGLCDTVAMKAYLDSHREAWEVLSREDSSALAIASSILSGAVMQVSDVAKDGDRRLVTYSLEADGHSKSRVATVRKEEGAWKVAGITDAH